MGKFSNIFYYTCIFVLSWIDLNSQVSNATVISIINSGFEGEAGCCKTPMGWINCGHAGETPPDIQPELSITGHALFGVTKIPYEGKTYVGMVVRSNETWERVSQRLTSKMLKGQCYSFSIFACRSDSYLSAQKENENVLLEYTTPVVLRIWGGEAYCHQKELLGESKLVDNLDWEMFQFELRPKTDLEYFEIEAFYKTPVLLPYNGNVLIDQASDLVPIPCPGTPDYKNYLAQKEKQLAQVKKKVDSQKPSSKPPANSLPVAQQKSETKILKQLDSKSVKVGQTIKIEKLYFDIDSSRIKPESYTVLNEVYDFLLKNPSIKIEVGGHTNSRPSPDFADRLSTRRAQAVRDYLVELGIDSTRINFKGYGKRSPIASNSTPEGRALNQRVEIKILSVL
ncbi:MAG: OmpA family protein [Saprospiraceae bacterium]|nr:OmpA family protein [Saprospiraceae bacterium]MBK7795688.1 OmpA family protein [Saprospiraceae bacterium]